MSRHYDRRPRRDWDRTDRRSIGESIGWVRLLGFSAILAASFLLLGRKENDTIAPAGAVPRIAADSAIAPVLRERLPNAQLRAGTSADLSDDLRSGMAFDVVVLRTDEVARLAADDRCSEATAVAARGGAQYATCLANANGSSRDLGDAAVRALTDLAGRDALLAAGFDIPETRPTTPATPTSP